MVEFAECKGVPSETSRRRRSVVVEVPFRRKLKVYTSYDATTQAAGSTSYLNSRAEFVKQRANEMQEQGSFDPVMTRWLNGWTATGLPRSNTHPDRLC